MDTLHKILDAMWKQGYSDADFCKDVGINKSAVTDWKKGKTKSYMRYLPRIADILDVSVEYLLEDDPSYKDFHNSAQSKETLTDKQKKVLDLAQDLSDEDIKKLIDYANLLKKAKNQ